jgi:hypothetical protein
LAAHPTRHDRDVKTSRILVPVVALAALAVGCSSTPTVDQSDLEGEVSAQLEQEVGTAPDDVSCPGDLTGEVGETMRCTLTAGEDELGLTVEVTEVDGEDVGFDIQVDEAGEGEPS